MKRILLSTVAFAAAVGIAGAANAADLPARAAPAYKAPVYAPIFSWTGLYIGGNIGWSWGDGSGTLTDVGGGTGNGALSGDGDGFIGGGQIGYNWQTGPWVFGVEADIQGSGADGVARATTAGGAAYVATTKTPWFATFRGRLGYSVDRWLFYVTGGGVLMENEINGTRTLGGVTTTYSSSDTGLSWTVGGGVEVSLNRQWSVKGEYLYIGTPDTVPVPPGARITGETNTHIIRAGLNYHF